MVCVSILDVSMNCGVCVSENVMLFLMYVIIPPPCLFCLSFLIGVYPGIVGVLCLGFSFVSCRLIMSTLCFCAVCVSSFVFLCSPSMFNWSIFSVLFVCGCVVGLF